MGNEIEIRITGKDTSGPAVDRARSAAKRAALDVESAQLKVQKATKATTEATQKWGAQSTQAREAANRQAKAELDLEQATTKQAKATAKAAEEDGRAAEQTRRAGTAAADAGERTRRYGAASSGAAEQTGRFRESLRQVAMTAAGFAAANVLGRGFGLINSQIRSTLQLGIDYQNQLNTMQAVTHATGAQMAAVAVKARDLGNDLSLPATSAAGAAQAMTELAKGNLTVQQSMDAAKGTLQLAAAAQIDGAQAATIQADALNAFSLKATQAGHVADVLANAANAATGEIGDFAYGLQASAAVAHQFRISLDDNVTALALFANAGIHGQDAGTSLKSALLALAHPSNKAEAALKTLGVRAFDAKGNFVGLKVISGELAVAQGHLSQQAFTAATATAFGSDAARAAGVLAANGAVGWDKMSGAIGRSGGAATAAGARMKGVGGAVQGLQSELETLKIDVFNKAAPYIERFVRALSDELPKALDAVGAGFTAVMRPVKVVADGFAAVTDGIRPLGGFLVATRNSLKPLEQVMDDTNRSASVLGLGLKPLEQFMNDSAKAAGAMATGIGPIKQTLDATRVAADAAKQEIAPMGSLIAASGHAATRSGLQQFFYDVGKAVAVVVLTVRDSWRVFQEWREKVVAAVKPAVEWVMRLAGWFVHSKQDVVHLAEALALVKIAVLAVRAAVVAWGVAQAIVAATNPATVLLALLELLAVAFVVAYTKSSAFRDGVNGALKSSAEWVKKNKDAMINFGLTVAQWGLRISAVILGLAAGWLTMEAVVLRGVADIVEGFWRMVSGILGILSHLPRIGHEFAAAKAEVDKMAGTAVRGLRATANGADALARAAAAAAQKARDLANHVREIKDHRIAIGILDNFTAGFHKITREISSTGAVTATVSGRIGYGPQKQATGGIVGAASGGVHGGLRWVGEAGAELVRLPYGSTVYPHGQSMGMAADAGGGNTYNINVTVAPGGHPARVGAEIVDLIRRYEQRSGTAWRTA